VFGVENPRRRVLHTSPEINWSICDGCNCLEVTDMTGSKLYQRTGKNGYSYKCSARRKNPALTRKEIYEMTKERCPMGRDAGEGRRR